MPDERSKLRLLALDKILFDETDADHGITTEELLGKLKAVGISAERKAVQRDIKALRELGRNITLTRGPHPTWRLASREFSGPELLLLVDAVQSSKFLTKTKSDDLSKKIRTLGSKHMRDDLKKNLHVEGRIKMQNESVFANVDIIGKAIRERRKVAFSYFQYDVNKKRVAQRDGELYTETPVQLVYSDGCYYLVVYNDKHADFAHYRVDRMEHVQVTEEPATRNETIATFNIEQWEARLFGMYTGRAVSATLAVDADAMGPVIDKFGRKIESSVGRDGRARVHVTVTESPTFFGWLAQLGTSVKLEKPARLRRAYKEYLQQIIDIY